MTNYIMTKDRAFESEKEAYKWYRDQYRDAVEKNNKLIDILKDFVNWYSIEDVANCDFDNLEIAKISIELAGFNQRAKFAIKELYIEPVKK